MSKKNLPSNSVQKAKISSMQLIIFAESLSFPGNRSNTTDYYILLEMSMNLYQGCIGWGLWSAIVLMVVHSSLFDLIIIIIIIITRLSYPSRKQKKGGGLIQLIFFLAMAF